MPRPISGVPGLALCGGGCAAWRSRRRRRDPGQLGEVRRGVAATPTTRPPARSVRGNPGRPRPGTGDERQGQRGDESSNESARGQHSLPPSQTRLPSTGPRAAAPAAPVRTASWSAGGTGARPGRRERLELVSSRDSSLPKRVRSSSTVLPASVRHASSSARRVEQVEESGRAPCSGRTYVRRHP